MVDDEYKPSMLPIPNDFYLIKSTATPTGYLLDIHPEEFLKSRISIPKLSADNWNRKDGWSPTGFIILSGLKQPIVIEYSGVVKRARDGQTVNEHSLLPINAQFASHLNINRSMEYSSPTVILDAITGEKIPHWIEVDHSDSHTEKDGKQTIIIQPASKLQNNRQYIVLLRNIYVNDGTIVRKQMRPNGFTRLLNESATEDADLNRRRDHFKQRCIFDKILKHTGARSCELFLAWDFTTSSVDTTHETLKSMRDIAYQAMTFSYKITEVQDNYSPLIYRKVKGFYDVPNFLVNQRKLNFPSYGNYTQLLRPMMNGYIQVPISIWIPRSLVFTDMDGVLRGTSNGSIMQYGHGLFMDREEPESEFLFRMANDEKQIIVCVDWWGLQKKDIMIMISSVTSNIAKMQAISHRASQAILNQLVLTKLLRYGNMHKDEKVFSVRGRSTVKLKNGTADNIVLYGISLGGILGTTLFALSDELHVAVLSVAGGPFSSLIPRNVFVTGSHDPTTFAHSLRSGRPLGLDMYTQLNMNKTALFQISPGDAMVNNIGSYFLMRSMNAVSMYNDPFEMDYVLPNEQLYRRNLTGRYIDAEDSVLDVVTLLSVLNPGGDIPISSKHNVYLTSFHFRDIPPKTPFYNIPMSWSDQKLYDSHELTRLCVEGQNQVKSFFREFVKQKATGNFSLPLIQTTPRRNGCWNLTSPDRSLLRRPRTLRRMILQN